MYLLKPQVVPLPEGVVTAFPDVIPLAAGAVVPNGWLGTADESLEMAHVRQKLEQAQRAETEDTYPGCDLRHFPGGTVILSPDANDTTRVSILLYGIAVEDGEWRPLNRLAQGPKDSPTGTG